MGDADSRAKLLFRLSSSKLGTTITANGNTGAYNANAGNSTAPNMVTAVDLRWVTDLALMVYCSGAVGGTGSPTLTVSLNTFDASGNLYAGVLSAAALSAPGGKVAYGGLFSGGTSQIVLPEWGQISWAVTGTNPSFSGVEISLYGR